MAEWQCKMTLLVRALINDLTEPYTYADSKLEQLIIACAQLIKKEIDFDYTYTINITEQTISPDPSSDDAFLNLVSMKTACLVLAGEVKTFAGSSMRVSDAGASIDLSDAYKNTKDLYDQLCKDFEKAKIAHALGNVSGIKAILTPYTVKYNTSPNIIFG